MEKKSFLFLQVRSSGEEQVELRRLQMQLALNNRRRCLNLVCLLLLLIPQRISQFLRFSLLLSSVSSRFNSLFFSLESMTSSMPPNCLLSNPCTLSSFSNTEHRIQKWFIHIKVYFVLSKKEEHISSRSSRHFVPTDQNKLCTHDKNRKRAELWVKINLFNEFVMYALGSVHEKFDV